METKIELLNIIQKESDLQKDALLKIDFLTNQIKELEKNLKQSNIKVNEINSILKTNFNIHCSNIIEKDFFDFISPTVKNIYVK